jgi:hypothetical protein
MTDDDQELEAYALDSLRRDTSAPSRYQEALAVRSIDEHAKAQLMELAVKLGVDGPSIMGRHRLLSTRTDVALSMVSSNLK